MASLGDAMLVNAAAANEALQPGVVSSRPSSNDSAQQHSVTWGKAQEENGHVSHALELEAAPGTALEDIQRMQIVYQDLRYTVQTRPRKRKNAPKGEKGGKVVAKDLLKGLSGVINPGRLTAVMGASGAGKTTMLNVLAGHTTGAGTISGNVSVNGESVNGERMRQVSAFVHQEDVILATMTVKEALFFAAQLKLPATLSTAEKQERALAVAETLNLTKTLDSYVGDSMLKGISGGEKRRLSMGLELLTNPAILFLDEPTSGLDTYNAYKCCCIMYALAHKFSRTVISTIHQPSSEVFQQFDDLIVLAEGEVMYHGLAKNMVAYFDRRGYTCPEYTNPADNLFMSILNDTTSTTSDMAKASSLADLRVASGGEQELADAMATGGEAAALEAAAEARRQKNIQRLKGLTDAWAASDEAAAMRELLQGSRSSTLLTGGISSTSVRAMVPLYIQLPALARRTMRNALRNKLMARGQTAQAIFISLIVGLIYLNTTDVPPAAVQARAGALFFLGTQGLFGSCLPALTSYGSEKGVFFREYKARLYGLPAYFWSRWLTLLPLLITLPVLMSCICYWMVGFQNNGTNFAWFALALVLLQNSGASIGILAACVFNSIEVAMAILPLFLTPLMIFSGFFVNIDTLGWWFRWISYISPVRYAYFALMLNEFGGLTFNCSPPGACPTPGYDGDVALQQYGIADKGSITQNLGILFGLMWAYLFVAYIALFMSVRRAVGGK